MAEINDLDTTDASNTARFPEAQAPSTVNDGARALEGLLARAFKDTIDGVITTGGTSTVYTAAANRTLSAYYDGLQLSLEFHTACGATPTLNVDGQGAQSLVWGDGTALAAGDIPTGAFVHVKYDLTNTNWIVQTPALVPFRGPASSTDDNVPQWDGTTGALLKDGLAVGTSANNLVQLDGSARLPAVDGSQLTGVNAGASRTNIRLAFALLSEAIGDRVNLDDGIADAFADEGDVDNATSSNEVYDASGDFYTGGAEAENGTYGTAATNTRGIGDANSRLVVGLQFTASASGTITEAKINVGAVTNSFTSHMELWTDSSGSPGSQVGSDSDTVDLTGTGEKTYTFSTPPSVTGSSVYWMVLVDSENNGSGNVSIDTIGDDASFGSGQHGSTITSITDTGAATASEEWRFGITLLSVANLTLVSNAFTAGSAPDTAHIHVQVKENESITINTDLTAEVSRDGGSNWTTATLALVETLADGTKAYEDADLDISGQPSGTSMKYRIATANTKDIEVHVVTLEWE